MPKTEETELAKTTVRMPRALWKRLRHRAVEDDCSAEALVVKALAAFLSEDGAR